VKFKIFGDSGKIRQQIEFDFLALSVLFYDKGCFGQNSKEPLFAERQPKLIIKTF